MTLKINIPNQYSFIIGNSTNDRTIFVMRLFTPSTVVEILSSRLSSLILPKYHRKEWYFIKKCLDLLSFSSQLINIIMACININKALSFYTQPEVRTS